MILEPKLVLIEWNDSAMSASSKTYSLDDMKGFELVKLTTVGFGIELENRYVLAMETQDSEDFRHVMAIPKVNITSIKYLYAKNPAK